MHMLGRPNQTIQTTFGRQYRADEEGVFANVEADDVAELHRAGCVDAPPLPAPVAPPASEPAAPEPAAPEPAAVAADEAAQ